VWFNGAGDGKPYDDSYFFRCGIAYTESYEVTPSEIKLFFLYQGKNYYLSFKPFNHLF